MVGNKEVTGTHSLLSVIQTEVAMSLFGSSCAAHLQMNLMALLADTAICAEDLKAASVRPPHQLECDAVLLCHKHYIRSGGNLPTSENPLEA